MIPLGPYFERIGWTGPRAPTLEVLEGCACDTRGRCRLASPRSSRSRRRPAPRSTRSTHAGASTSAPVEADDVGRIECLTWRVRSHPWRCWPPVVRSHALARRISWTMEAVTWRHRVRDGRSVADTWLRPVPGQGQAWRRRACEWRSCRHIRRPCRLSGRQTTPSAPPCEARCRPMWRCKPPRRAQTPPGQLQFVPECAQPCPTSSRRELPPLSSGPAWRWASPSESSRSSARRRCVPRNAGEPAGRFPPTPRSSCLRARSSPRMPRSPRRSRRKPERRSSRGACGRRLRPQQPCYLRVPRRVPFRPWR